MNTAVQTTSTSNAQWCEQLTRRIVDYCAIDTPSDSTTPADRVPSTDCQWDLLKALQTELTQLGASDIVLTDNGFLMATVPGNHTGPTIALLAHVDTTTQFKATEVKPLVHKNWDGKAIVLPDDNNQVLDPEQFPYLAKKMGHDIVTASGTTLLGADDKAGVAIAMTVLEHMIKHPELPRPAFKVCFTPDEEIGRGSHHLPLDVLGADFAYTLDGSKVGDLCYETFSANRAEVEITGVSIHPGEAKDKMVNALVLAAQLITALPQHKRTPETTEGREGFIYTATLKGTADFAKIQFTLRDFELDVLASHGEVIRKLCEGLQAGEPRAKIEYKLIEQYRNMRYILEKDMKPVDVAAAAYRNCGLEPVSAPLRGGTDGSVLTARGLPCPNLFTGMQNYHGPLEWVSVQDMQVGVQVCIELLKQCCEAPKAS
jgi:tripeptide aminopeptidase